MTHEEFSRLAAAQFDACKAVLLAKTDEYAGSERDQLHAFYRAAALMEKSSYEALAGILVKHIVSIYSMCVDASNGGRFSEERWAEKITDSINYLVLLRALVEEDRE